MRVAYQFHHLSDTAKEVAEKQNKGTLLTQWLYNEDGTKFQTSTVVYSPIKNQKKPFIYNGNRFNRNELDKMGFSNQCKSAIINYR